MIEIRRILCPIDFSDFSRRGLEHAGAIAAWYKSTVTLLHVCAAEPPAAYAPGSPILPSAVLTPEDREELLGAMRRFAETAAGAGVPLQFEIAQGFAAAEILAKADALKPDLLVMGTHGRAGFERLVLGSVTEKVLRKATCPVLTVPRTGAEASPHAVFTRILCAIDFSEYSMQGLKYAMSMAQEADARLTVLHVIELPPEWPADLHETVRGGPRSFQEYVAAAEAERRERLESAVPPDVRTYCTVETRIVPGTPYREILRAAADEHSDLIVIGIHGRGAVDRLFFGSTTQHIIREATCPVLTLRRS